MGVCGSRPKVKEGNQTASLAEMGKTKHDHHKKRRRVRRILRRRIVSRKIDDVNSFDRSITTDNPSQDIAWFDSTSALDSEYDEEFYSIHDDIMSLNGSEIVSRLSVSDAIVQQHQKTREQVLTKNVSSVNGVRVEVNPEELSTTGGPRLVETVTDVSCGILSNACRPCRQAVVLPVEKKRLSVQDASQRKTASKRSFKWREGSSLSDLTLTKVWRDPTVYGYVNGAVQLLWRDDNQDRIGGTLSFPKALNHRPIAGSSVSFCPLEKQIPDCWSPIDPSFFKVRGKNYLRDKKKEVAPNSVAFHPIGADVFLSQKKIDHISRFVHLPVVNIPGEVPSILVVNIQIPLYSATIFQTENDGEGMNVVLYFKLSEKFSEDLPAQFRENISKLLNDEVERVKSFPLDTIAPFRDRLKILGRVANVDELPLTATEKKLMNSYNEKPVLSRPQHEFYLGENYLEIDLDVHRFGYIARKGFESFHERMKYCTLDFGLTIQGNKTEDLPENLLCAMRLNKIDRTKYS